MAADNPGIPESFDTFRRYRDGVMSHAEQHAFERRMLDEPALADAYEGFLAWENRGGASHRLTQALRERLHERLAERPVQRIAFWPYAAAACILLGVGIFVAWDLSEKQHDVQETTSVAADMPAVIRSADAGTDTGKPASEPGTLAPASKQTPPAPGQASDEVITSEVVDPGYQASETLADANIQESVPATVAAEPAQARRDSGRDASTSEDSVLPPWQGVKNSVARSGFAASRPARATAAPVPAPGPASAREGARMLAADTVPQAAPAGGWEAYQKYLREASAGSGKTGRVLVSFTVAADGELTGFRTEGTAALYDRAIEIVKKGPRWQPLRTDGRSQNAPVQLALDFR